MRLQNDPDVGNFFVEGGLFDPPPAAPAAMSLQVNHDNVLQAGHILHNAAEDARGKLHELALQMVVQACGEDIVSKEAAEAWNARLNGGPESYAARLAAYVQSVWDLADQLKGTAKQYGYTEEEVNNAFKSIGAQGD